MFTLKKIFKLFIFFILLNTIFKQLNFSNFNKNIKNDQKISHNNFITNSEKDEIEDDTQNNFETNNRYFNGFFSLTVVYFVLLFINSRFIKDLKFIHFVLFIFIELICFFIHKNKYFADKKNYTVIFFAYYYYIFMFILSFFNSFVLWLILFIKTIEMGFLTYTYWVKKNELNNLNNQYNNPMNQHQYNNPQQYNQNNNNPNGNNNLPQNRTPNNNQQQYNPNGNNNLHQNRMPNNNQSGYNNPMNQHQYNNPQQYNQNNNNPNGNNNLPQNRIPNNNQKYQ